MAEWIRWTIGLMVTICLIIIPALARMYSLLQILVERTESNKKSIGEEKEARVAADNDQCRRLNSIEDTMEQQGKLLDRIDERTGWIVVGLQRAGVVDKNN